MSIHTDTTERMSSVTTLDQIRDVQTQINALALRWANRTQSPADQEQLAQLRERLVELRKQYTAECLQQKLDNLYQHTRTP